MTCITQLGKVFTEGMKVLSEKNGHQKILN